MGATATESPNVVLLIIQKRRLMFPMSTVALTVGQGSQEKLNRDYKDALILEDDGTVQKFDRVEVIGFWGESPLEKLFSFLYGTRRINVVMSPFQIQLTELKAIVVECILNGGYWDDEGSDEEGRYRIAKEVELAADNRALFRVLDLGTPEDALDEL